MWTALASRALDCLTCGAGTGRSAAAAATTEAAAAADSTSTTSAQQPHQRPPPASPPAQHKPAAEVLLPDGKVLRVPHKTRCADLVAAHPRTRVFPATVLVGRPGKALPEDAPLQGGQVYALLPVGTRMRMAFTLPKDYLSLLRGPAGGYPATTATAPPPAPAGAVPAAASAAVSSDGSAAAGPRSGGPSLRQRLARGKHQQQQQQQQQQQEAAAAVGAEEEEQHPPTTTSGHSGVAMRRGPSRVHDWSGPLQNWSGPLHSISETEADD